MIEGEQEEAGWKQKAKQKNQSNYLVKCAKLIELPQLDPSPPDNVFAL